jgi:hypothetical protein
MFVISWILKILKNSSTLNDSRELKKFEVYRKLKEYIFIDNLKRSKISENFK